MTKLDLQNIAAILDATSAPTLVVSGELKVLWNNSAARLLLGQDFADTALEEILGLGIVNRIKSNRGLGIFDTQIKIASGSRLNQTILVIDLGAGDPGSEKFLLYFASSSEGLSDLRRTTDALSTAAHDLKNPLGAIFGYSDALLDTPIGAGLSDKQREIIQRMRMTASRTIGLVRNYQYLGEISGGILPKASTGIDLNDSVRAVIEYTFRDPEHSAKITCNLSSASMKVNIETSHLERVISNLLANALNYTPREGTISITTAIQDKNCLFKIHNCPGFITEAEQANIFGRFVRGSSSRGQIGAGLGLYITKVIVDAFGGTLTLKSEKDFGTEFTVSLPAS